MKHVLITGASKGLGLDLVQIFLKNEWIVWGISRSTTPELDILIKEYPRQMNWRSFDLGEPEKVREMIFKDFVDIKVPLSGFVNNAAIAYDDIITNLQVGPLENMYKVNVFTPMIISKYVIRNMLYHRIPGSIVHISSISAHTGYKGLAMYASTKGALEAFSKNTAREWGVKGIRSNCVVAGFMETDMSAVLSDDQKGRIYNRTALKKATSINSVAESVYFLHTEKAASITGQNLHVDSGTI
ncbi:MAG: SDR family NAD(P)-dependent oxidoreductase [bacterium]|nr:SDR family NAD(P)-dependent oxidoreductase [bacterium]